MSKVLVTGGAGFIGSHVAGAFARDGHEVVVSKIEGLGWGSRLGSEGAVRRATRELLGEIKADGPLSLKLDHPGNVRG